MTEAEWYSDEAATFGDRLAAAREARGMASHDLAHRLGVTDETLEAWENDTAEPRANRLTMLSGVLNVSLPWLLTGEGRGPGGEASGGSPGAQALLSEMGLLRAEMARAAQRMAVLEKRLRAELADDG